ncbi:hypothetical protein H5410_060755 [Solanum commersonii]|uniref:ATP-dependent DNA helicase n=1 Tax=Solanum commersonii TaxID=4109 RepID=A0A9J5W5X6_SOLCO|nr:hypothetical protein H5410_060755 [Solanum commersonii]
MSEDCKNIPNLGTKSIQHLVRNHINKFLHLMGHNIKEYNFFYENIIPSRITKEEKDSHFERNIIVNKEDLLLQTKLNPHQKGRLIQYLIGYIQINQVFFLIEGPGGIGKTFLSENSSMTIDEIVDTILGTKSGYIKGLGYGPKPNTTRSTQRITTELEDSLKKAKQEAVSAQLELQNRLNAAETVVDNQ